mmetsp:Transcript_119531/g.338287  ORF Transcript_119531/g.338287 Transcript_119531/m.338287 type:complete len:243 (-) Transcript_119531:774-1502(-)
MSRHFLAPGAKHLLNARVLLSFNEKLEQLRAVLEDLRCLVHSARGLEVTRAPLEVDSLLQPTPLVLGRGLESRLLLLLLLGLAPQLFFGSQSFLFFCLCPQSLLPFLLSFAPCRLFFLGLGPRISLGAEPLLLLGSQSQLLFLFGRALRLDLGRKAQALLLSFSDVLEFPPALSVRLLPLHPQARLVGRSHLRLLHLGTTSLRLARFWRRLGHGNQNTLDDDAFRRDRSAGMATVDFRCLRQ